MIISSTLTMLYTISKHIPIKINAIKPKNEVRRIEITAVITIHNPVRFLKKNKVTIGIISAKEEENNILE